MSRKKIIFEDKKKNFGITLNPEIYKLLDLKAEQEGKSRSVELLQYQVN